MELDPKDCKPGQEQYKKFPDRIRRGRKLVQYDYRNSAGKLFSTVATTLDEARARRDKWAEKEGM